LLALVAGAFVTVRVGVALAHRLPGRALSTCFGLFLCANGGHLLLRAVG